MKNLAKITAIILVSTSLGGCLGLEKLLAGLAESEGSESNGTLGYENVGVVDPANPETPGGNGQTISGAAGKGSSGANAIKLSGQRSRADSATKISRPTATAASVNVVGNTAGLIVAGSPTIENSFRDPVNGGLDPNTGLMDTLYHTNDEPNSAVNLDGEITISRVDGVDDFFFFDTEKSILSQTSVKADFVAGAQGTFAPVAKVKTATFKGKATGDFISGSGFEGSYQGTSEITANLTTKKLNAKLVATNGVTNDDNNTVDGIGTVVSLTDADIYGNTFSGGNLALNKSDGTALATFAQGNAVSAGGFFGDNAEYAAGTLFGIGSMAGANNTTDQVIVTSDFWGRDEAQPEAQ